MAPLDYFASAPQKHSLCGKSLSQHKKNLSLPFLPWSTFILVVADVVWGVISWFAQLSFITPEWWQCVDWKGALEVSSPVSCSEQESWRADFSGSCPVRFWVSQRADISQPLWNPVPVFDHPHREFFFLTSNRSFPHYNLMQNCQFMPRTGESHHFRKSRSGSYLHAGHMCGCSCSVIVGKC